MGEDAIIAGLRILRLAVGPLAEAERRIDPDPARVRSARQAQHASGSVPDECFISLTHHNVAAWFFVRYRWPRICTHFPVFPDAAIGAAYRNVFFLFSIPKILFDIDFQQARLHCLSSK